MASYETRTTIPASTASTLEPTTVRLEQGEVAYFPASPIELPGESDREFLAQLRVLGNSGRDISFVPGTGAIHHLGTSDASSMHRLRAFFETFCSHAKTWLTEQLPEYARSWEIGPMTLSTEEEATRSLRFSQREDLLHIDPFPGGPSNGRRLLKFCLNLNPTEPRVWATSDGLARILERFGSTAGFPTFDHASWVSQVRQGVWQLLDVKQRGRSNTDDFLSRLRDYLKTNDQLQERGPKRFWHFAPNSAWLVMTDGLSHSVLRGRHALEMSIFIDPSALSCPSLSPTKIVEQFRNPTEKRRAA